MKTIWTLILGLFLTANIATAQDTLYVYEAGEVVSQRAIINVDSVVFLKMYLSTISTTSASAITTNSATSGGTVTADGCSSVTARGVCWSTTSSPTVSNSKTINSTGTGSFTSSITGLSEFTTYYVRAYATNSKGTAYGSQVSFTTTGSFPTSGLIGKWTFNANANDLSGTGNNGTLSAGISYVTDRFGSSNSAIKLNSGADLMCTTNSFVNPNPFSISFWFKSAPGSAGYNLISFNNGQCSHGGNWDRVVFVDESDFGFFVYNGQQNYISNPASFKDNTWRHCVVLFSSSGLKIYINGSLFLSNAISTAQNYTGYWRIGGLSPNDVNNSSASDIDDVGIWNRVLTQQEITNLYNAQ